MPVVAIHSQERGRAAKYFAAILLKSKKARAFIVTALVVVLNDKIGLSLDPATLDMLVYLACSYMVGQGVADHGKGAAEVSADTSILLQELAGAEEAPGATV